MCFNTPNFFDERDPLTADTFSDTGADVDEEDDDDADTDADADAMTAFAARDACIPLSGEYSILSPSAKRLPPKKTAS